MQRRLTDQPEITQAALTDRSTADIAALAGEIHRDLSAIKRDSTQVAEYTRFGDKTKNPETTTSTRAIQIAKFIDGNRGRIAHNVFDYPELDKTTEEIIDETLRTRMMRFLLELHIAKANGVSVDNQEELELLADYCDVTLKKMALIESAQHMHLAASTSSYEAAREQFTRLCHELFGEIDKEISLSMLDTEQNNLDALNTNDEETKNIAEYLQHTVFNSIDTSKAQPEQPLLSSEKLREAKEILDVTYADMLAVIPETDDAIIYDASQCQNIIQQALDAQGLHNWVCKVGEVTSPDTRVDEKAITISSNEKRTAKQLRCLVLHEVGVHALRGQNGENSGFSVLKRGTADYGDVEEGLGVMFEIIHTGDLKSAPFDRARDRYIVASLIEGTNGSEPMDAQGAFEATWRLLAVRAAKTTDGIVTSEHISSAKAMAVKHIENAFRGTSFREAGTMYSKLITYYHGLVENAAWLRGVEDIAAALDMAMLGKFNHTNPREVDLVRRIAKNEVQL